MENHDKQNLSPEAPKTGRPFTEIQNEISSLVNNPDPDKERGLRIERARLINEAKSIGVDYGILGAIKHQMLDIETHNPSIVVSAQLINEIDSDRLEAEANGLLGWDDRFAGLIDEYKQGALRNLSLAYLKKSGASQRDVDRLQREIDLLNWGAPPSIINTMPIQPDTVNTAFGFTADELGRAIAREQGVLSPQAYLLEAVDGEEYLKTAQRIVPGQEPRFWGILTDKEKEEWMVRSTLWIIAAKKAAALGSDELCMDKMQDFAVELNKSALQTLFGRVEGDRVEVEGKAGTLPIAGLYTTIIGDPQFRDWMGQYGQLDGRGVNHAGLYNPDGLPSSINLKSVLFGDFDKIITDIGQDYGADILYELGRTARDLKSKCPDSIYPHDTSWGKTINAEGFKMLRKSIRFWLVTSGRDLLLSADELANRDEFFENKAKALETLEFRAREAEVIAWNFVYSMGLLETFDTRQYRPEGTKRHVPSAYWSLALWTCMHLQERFEAKVIRGNASDSAEAKEEWASSLGTWALRNYQNGVWTTESADHKKKINIPRILPDVMFRGALFSNNFVFQSGRLSNQGDQPSTSKDNETMYPILNSIGRELLQNPQGLTRFELAAKIDWNKVSDTPFVSYIWDELRWANTIERVFKKGQESKVSMQDLGEAMRNLRLPYASKIALLITHFGVDPNSSKLQPNMNRTKWLGVLSGLGSQYPNLFLDK